MPILDSLYGRFLWIVHFFRREGALRVVFGGLYLRALGRHFAHEANATALEWLRDTGTCSMLIGRVPAAGRIPLIAGGLLTAKAEVLDLALHPLSGRRQPERARLAARRHAGRGGAPPPLRGPPPH